MNGKKDSNTSNHTTLSRRFIIISVATILAIILVFVCMFMWQNGTFRNISQAIKYKGSYQAVFLANGQLYFGKISEITNNYLILKTPHYLQQDEEKDLTLVSIKDEFHKPKDYLLIEKSSVIYIEELRAASEIADAILSN